MKNPFITAAVAAMALVRAQQMRFVELFNVGSLEQPVAKQFKSTNWLGKRTEAREKARRLAFKAKHGHFA